LFNDQIVLPHHTTRKMTRYNNMYSILIKNIHRTSHGLYINVWSFFISAADDGKNNLIITPAVTYFNVQHLLGIASLGLGP